MKKYIAIIAGGIMVAIIGIAILAILNLGTLIKSVTEEYGPQFTQTDVRLGSADISFLSGSGSLSDFYLGNPKGFSQPSAIECNTIRVTVNKESLTTDRIIIEEIFVEGPVITYERKGKTDNFKSIVNNIKKAVSKEKSEQPKEEKGTSEPAAGGKEKTIQINNFIVKNGQIKLAGSLLNTFGGDDGVSVSLPDLHIKDIGKEKETSPAEAFAIILGELTGDISGSVNQAAKQLQEGVSKAVEGVKEGAGAAGKAVEDVGGAIKGLFGSDKE